MLALEYDEARGLLFSAGEDGTVRVWDPVHRTLIRRLQVTHLAASMLAISPAPSTHIAVLETDSARTRALSVWDWEKEKQVFRIEVQEAPLFLRYSGGGTFLLWGESRWESLRIVNAVTGEAVPFASEGFGIVSFAEIGAGEKTLLTYQPAGRLAYWDLASGSLVRELVSVPYLSGLRISRDKRFLLGSTGREAVLVDLLTGAVRTRAPVSGVLSADISASGSELAFAAGPGPEPGLSLWTLAGESVVRGNGAPSLPAAVITRFGGQGLFAAIRGGEIMSITKAGEGTLFARDELAEVTGIDVLGGRVALATVSRIWVFSSSLLAGGTSAARAPLIEAFSVPNPHAAASGVSFLSSDRLLAWKKGGEPAASLVLDIAARSFMSSAINARGSFLEYTVQPPGNPLAGLLLSIEQGGAVRLSDPLTGQVRYESLLPGMHTVVALGRSELAGGRNAAIATEGSLLRINMDTGETVGIPTRAVFTYELAYAPASGALYSIGVDAAGATSLFRHSGRSFETETVIDRVDWEDLFATLTLDSSTGLLFSSLGSARIGVWDAGSLALMRFPDTGRIPRSLRARDGLLCALARDSTVGVWDERGAHLAEIALFTDGQWAFLLPDGRFAASPAGQTHLSVTVNGSPLPDIDACRVR